MKFRIHFEWPDGTDDSFEVSGETVDEIRDKAAAFFKTRNLSDESAWSEELA